MHWRGKMGKYSICNVDIEKIQNVLIELLDEVDRICKENDIKYFLSGGTLLGCIRHRGFIPWDDDVDLWMTRKNFNRFRKAIKKDLNSKYFFEDYKTNIKVPLSIMKIEKKGTKYVEKIFKDLDIGNSIYLDIFPLDGVVKPFFKFQTAILIKMQSIRNYRLLEKNKKSNPLLKRIAYGLIPLRLCRFITEFTMGFFSIFKTKYVNQLCHRGRHWPLFEKSDIDDLIQGDFCGKKYPIPRNSDKILKQCYGDYMKLPPEEDMQPSHNIVECSLGE